MNVFIVLICALMVIMGILDVKNRRKLQKELEEILRGGQ